MSLSSLPLRSALLLFAWASYLFAPALSTDAVHSQQLRIPAAALEADDQVRQILSDGELLERDGRWGEALTHYEEALREHPTRQDLEQKLSLARIHYDLGRRYSDSSFLRALDAMDSNRVLDIYAEVLLKIQAHHVDAPNWQKLLRYGTYQTEVALTDHVFLDRHLPDRTTSQIEQFRSELRQVVSARQPRTRIEAREVAALAGRYATQRLGVPAQAVVMEYICGAISSLDMYSSYLTGGQLDEVMSQIEGNFVGLGIELKADQQSLLIVGVISGGPAAHAGIKAGDRIIEVADSSTTDVSTDAAADMLKGPEGSLVDITIRSRDSTVHRLQLRRARVEVPSVENAHIADSDYGIAYLKLTSFQKTTLRDFDAALWSLHRQGMKSLIVDVRGNPGGLLTAAVEVADKFVSGGNIVSTRGRSPREDFDYKAHMAGTWRVPLIVLIDGDSASASEIFAAAIHDHRRGTVIGQRSFGKGSVQGIFPLNVVKGGVRLTTAKFYSPSGRAISKTGVSPDVVVHEVAKPVSEEAVAEDDPSVDTILNAGLQVARQQLTQR